MSQYDWHLYKEKKLGQRHRGKTIKTQRESVCVCVCVCVHVRARMRAHFTESPSPTTLFSESREGQKQNLMPSFI